MCIFLLRGLLVCNSNPFDREILSSPFCTTKSSSSLKYCAFRNRLVKKKKEEYSLISCPFLAGLISLVLKSGGSSWCNRNADHALFRKLGFYFIYLHLVADLNFFLYFKKRAFLTHLKRND